MAVGFLIAMQADITNKQDSNSEVNICFVLNLSYQQIVYSHW